MGSWAEQDLVKAGSYLDKLTPGSTRDSAVLGYTQKAVVTDPEGAAMWAATIAEPARRETALAEVVQRWKMQNAADADAWLAQTTALSAEAKAKIIEKSKTATQVYRSEFE